MSWGKPIGGVGHVILRCLVGNAIEAIAWGQQGGVSKFSYPSAAVEDLFCGNRECSRPQYSCVLVRSFMYDLGVIEQLTHLSLPGTYRDVCTTR